VFIGTTLRGTPGALAALGGIMLLPAALILVAGALFFRHQAAPWLDRALTGLGAAAIGLTLATGWRMTRRGVRGVRALAVMAGVALAIGVARLPLLLVLVVAIPASVLLLGRADA
jgi:chromate transporter